VAPSRLPAQDKQLPTASLANNELAKDGNKDEGKDGVEDRYKDGAHDDGEDRLKDESKDEDKVEDEKECKDDGSALGAAVELESAANIASLPGTSPQDRQPDPDATVGHPQAKDEGEDEGNTDEIGVEGAAASPQGDEKKRHCFGS